MKKLTIFTVTLGIAAITLGGCTVPENTPNQLTSEDTTQFTIAVGETFSVMLESNPTTGYSWIAGFDEAMLIQESDTFVETANDPQLVGVGGMQTFTFRGKNAGTTELMLKYMRPWESVQPIEERAYTVNIAE